MPVPGLNLSPVSFCLVLSGARLVTRVSSLATLLERHHREISSREGETQRLPREREKTSSLSKPAGPSPVLSPQLNVAT